MTSNYFRPRTPRLFAHRGASAHFPENTLPSFEAAIQAGIVYLELDVWATRDGHVVVHHDESTQRLTGVDSPITSLDLSELRDLDAGHTFTKDNGATFPFRGEGIVVPTLSEVLRFCPTAFVNIEIKQDSPAIEGLVIETVQRENASKRVLLAAEKSSVMSRIRPLCGDIPTSFSFADVSDFFKWVSHGCKEEYAPSGRALQIPERWGEKTLVSPEFVRAAHATGLEVHVWTVNNEEDIHRLLEMGVDGIMSDYPERLLPFL